MNIVEFNNNIKAVRTWLKENEVEFVGDKPNSKINPIKVIFQRELPADFTLEIGDIGVDYVKSGSAASVVGFSFTKEGVTVTNLNDVIGCKSFYNGNRDHTVYSPTKLIETGFEGDLILVSTWECDSFGEIEECFTLHTTPNLKALREAVEKEDELRWIEELVTRTSSKNSGRR